MHANARIQKARALLKDASRAFDADEIREGSRLMWEASKSAISAVAEQRGWPHETCDDLRQVIYRLDHDGENAPMKVNPLKSYFVKFTIAGIYRERGETEDGEYDYGDEFAWTQGRFKKRQSSVRAFIDRLESDLDDDWAIQ